MTDALRGETETMEAGVRMTWDEMKLKRDRQLAFGKRGAGVYVPLSYVGVRPCGCVVSWASARLPAAIRRTELTKWQREGLSVGRMTVEQAKVALAKPCNHSREPPSPEKRSASQEGA